MITIHQGTFVPKSTLGTRLGQWVGLVGSAHGYVQSIAGITRAETRGRAVYLATWQFPKGTSFRTMFYLNTATKNCMASSCQTAELLLKLTFQAWSSINKCTNALSNNPSSFGEKLQSNSTGTNPQPRSCLTTLMLRRDLFLLSGWKEHKLMFVIMSWIGL